MLAPLGSVIVWVVPIGTATIGFANVYAPCIVRYDQHASGHERSTEVGTLHARGMFIQFVPMIRSRFASGQGTAHQG
jgi:hypothetical protein